MTAKRSSTFFGATGGQLDTPNTCKTLRDDTSASVAMGSLGATWTNSGALTADTWKTLVTITGSGKLDFAAVKTNDATSRTVGLRVVLDGSNAVDRSRSIATSGNGIAGPGYVPDAGTVPVYQAMPFKTSMLIQVKSSITETDKLALACAYTAKV